RRQRVGIRARPAEQTPGGLAGQGGPQQMLGVQVAAAVLGRVLGGAPDQFPGRLTEQPPYVDLPGARARAAEEAGEEFSEGVVALRTTEAAGHGLPFRRPDGRTGTRSLI